MDDIDAAPTAAPPAAPESAELEVALADLLATHPDALVTGIHEDGLFAPLPESFDVKGHRVLKARSALDLVQPGHREPVIRAWERVKATGAAVLTVSVIGDQGGSATLHFLDVRPVYGVFVGVMVPVDAAPHELDHVAAIPAAVPRLARTRKDELAVILAIEPAVTAMLGWEPAEMVGRRSLEFIHPDDHDQAINTWIDVLTAPGATARARLRHRHRDGRWIWLEIANRNALDDEGYVDCEMFDISEEMEAHEAVRASEQLLRRLAGALPVGVVQFDAQRRIRYANDRLREIVGASEGTPDRDLFGAVVETAAFDDALDHVLDGHDVDTELHLAGPDGTRHRICTLALRALTATDGAVTGAVGCVTDVTDAARMRAELEQRATYDELTGSLNRATTLSRLRGALATRTDVAVVFVDLDGFKAINDRYGHAAGDLMLVTVASRVRASVRGDDSVGRIGGDEFLVICADVADVTTAIELGVRVADAVAVPLEVDGEMITPRASVGVAWAGGRAAPVGADELVAEADAAMYTSKSVGDGRPVVSTRPVTRSKSPSTVGSTVPCRD